MFSDIFTTILLIFFLMSSWKNKVLAGKVYIEDINILYVNDTYIDKDTFDVSINYKANSDNTLNANVDAIKETDKEIFVQLSVATRSFGYEIPMGIGFTSNLCKDRIGKGVFEQVAIPFGIKDCPPKKGSYTLEDFEPDFSKASFLASGAHLSLDFQVFSEDDKIVQVKAFIVA